MSFLQTQIQIANLPINNLISGYNNEVNTSIAVVSGSNNRINTLNTKVVGNNNYVFGKRGTNDITGSNNSASGNDNSITGSSNIIKGDNIITLGDNNNLRGSFLMVFGSTNSTGSLYSIQKTENISVSGDNNTLTGLNLKVFGNNNNIGEGWNDTQVFGNYNNFNSGLYIPDISGYTQSGPSQSLYPSIIQSGQSYILGNKNQLGTASTDVKVFGNSNLISASVSNAVIFGNGETINTINDSQFYIGSSYSVNIKSAVLPCNLIQDYTPTQQNDPAYVAGAITKDDNNIYVRTTNMGWREIPFNNSYGNFYSTVTQTNPIASTANTFTFSNTAQSQNVSIVNNSKVTVDFDGLYNIQFSVQLDKTDSGKDDVDIWLSYNGTNVDWSNTVVTLPDNNSKLVAAWNLVQPMTASSYIELMWSSPDTSMRAFAQAAKPSPDRPGTPSIILTIDKISSI